MKSDDGSAGHAPSGDEAISSLLADVARGVVAPAAALERLRDLPYRDMGVAKIDHHRELRQGVPEVVFGVGKTSEELSTIARAFVERGQTMVVTRLDRERAERLRAEQPKLEYLERARMAKLVLSPVPKRNAPPVAIVSAGTSDLHAAEEAAEMLAAMGYATNRIYDVGVAGIHRLFNHVDELRRAPLAIVVAGMEGALPSVIGGLVSCPVIAVPTDVGYGTALSGFTALFAMLTSCASGLSVVNIDNGFGAAMAAHRILASYDRHADRSATDPSGGSQP